MWRGLLMGAGAGLALSALLVAATSLLVPTGASVSSTVRVDVIDAPAVPAAVDPAPRPPVEPAIARTPAASAPLENLPVPSDSVFSRPREDAGPVMPGADALPSIGGGAAPRPDIAPLQATPAPDTSSVLRPATSAVAPLARAPGADTAPARPASAAGAMLASIDSARVAASPTGPAVARDLAPASPVGSAQPDGDIASPRDGITSSASQPVRPRLVPEAEVVRAPPAPRVVPEEVPAPAATPATMPQRIVLDSDRDARADAASTDRKIETAALTTDAAFFENLDGRPLFGIVLIDDPVGVVARADLAALAFPVTFVVDPTIPDAAAVAQGYRDAGHEVLISADALPADGTVQDLEVAIAGARSAMPGTVGLLDRRHDGFAQDRETLAGLLAPLADAGMGFVAYDGGLNTGIQTALREGVPAASVLSSLDDDAATVPVIGRYLDRATFDAALQGRAIVIVRTTPDTAAALSSWAQGGRAETVALAPISHILRAAAAQ